MLFFLAKHKKGRAVIRRASNTSSIFAHTDTDCVLLSVYSFVISAIAFW